MHETPPAPTEGLIPPGGSFDGLIEADGAVRIDGTVEGEVIVAESLWVGTEMFLTSG